MFVIYCFDVINLVSWQVVDVRLWAGVGGWQDAAIRRLLSGQWSYTSQIYTVYFISTILYSAFTIVMLKYSMH